MLKFQLIILFVLIILSVATNAMPEWYGAQATTTEKESTSQNYVGSNINVGGNAALEVAILMPRTSLYHH